MKKEYIIAFSSFYKAMYAQEKLQAGNYRALLKRLPPELIKSCGYALYLRTGAISEVRALLEENGILPKAVFRIDTEDGKDVYRRIS